MARLSMRVLTLVVVATLALPVVALGAGPKPKGGGPTVATTVATLVNDAFADAIDLGEATTGSTDGTTVGATHETGDPWFNTDWYRSPYYIDDFYSRSIWYTWTAPVGVGPTTFEMSCPTCGWTPIGIYTGAALGSLSEVAFNEISPVDEVWTIGRVDFEPTAGTTYRIALGSQTEGDPLTLSWYPTPDGASNDNFASAMDLTPDGTGLATAIGDTLFATFESGEPTFEFPDEPESLSDLGGRSVWYRYVSATDGSVTISLRGSTFDTVLGVYTGSLGSLTDVAFNDDTFDHASEVTFSASDDTTYYIGIGGVGGYFEDSGQVMQWGDSGSYTLTMKVGDLAVPDAPAAPDATSGQGHIDLSWSAPANDGGMPVTSYELGYAPNSCSFYGYCWTYLAPEPAAATSMTVDGLTNGTLYAFKVRASSAYGEGVYSDVTLAMPVGVPPEPPDLTGLQGDNGFVRFGIGLLSDGGSTITAYTVAYKEHTATVWDTTTRTSTGSTQISGLTNSVLYDFRVMATNAYGSTPYSGIQSAMPHVLLMTGTAIKLKGATAILTYSTPPAGWTYQCSLDGGGYDTCPSPTTFANLAHGPHTVTMQASIGSYAELNTKTISFSVKSGKVKSAP